ncbi:MAG: cupin domain-containing protein [Methylococcales bacterium]
MTNLFSAIPKQLPEELFTTLLQQGNVRIERIVSQGHSTPPEAWYDQAWDEWLILLQGQATLVYKDLSAPVHLSAGDYLFIPAHHQHRVDWTPADVHTIWLAVHLSAN